MRKVIWTFLQLKSCDIDNLPVELWCSLPKQIDRICHYHLHIMAQMTQKTLTFTEQVNLKIYICMQFTSFRKDVSVFRFYNNVATTDDPLEYLTTHPDYYYYSIINNVAQLLLMKEYRIVTNTTRSVHQSGKYIFELGPR